MDNRFVNGWWPYGIGVVLAVAMLFGGAANAAPCGADAALRGTGKSGTELTRLVTGDPAQINEVIAGIGPTAILAVNPVPVPAGVTPPNPYPPGTTIVGNELRAEVGGFRAWFNVQVSNWDPLGNGPNALFYQVKIDCTNYKGVNAVPPNPGVDLTPAIVACTTDAECVAAFGENWTSCESGKCKTGYLDSLGTGRPDSWCAGGCSFGDVATGTCNYTYFSVFGAIPGRRDGGIVYYGGTLVLDIPAAARGKYIVNLSRYETFMACPGDWCDIDAAEANGFVVNILTGQCCYGLGTPDAGCVDGLLRSECDAEPSLSLFIPGAICPPQGPNCSSYFGSCCETISGECLDEVVEADCQGTHRVWNSETLCGEVECNADTGACCDHDPFGPCTDDTVLSACQCATCTWHKLQACAEINCAPTPIPTVSEWGLAIITMLLLTGAKIYFGRSETAKEPSDRR